MPPWSGTEKGAGHTTADAAKKATRKLGQGVRERRKATGR